jgi:hypothetical protein
MAALGPINTKQHQHTTEHETTALHRYSVPLPETLHPASSQLALIDPQTVPFREV